MSESQTKAGNQECFAKTCKTCKTCKLASLQNLPIDLWDMLNNFCFHVYAQKSLFINLQNLQNCKTCKLAKLANWSLGHAEQLLFSCLCSKVTVYRWKWQWFFFDLSLSTTLTCYFTVHRAGSQLKMSERQTKLGTRNILQNLQIGKTGKLILGTCWTTFVFMSMLKSHCL